MPSTHSCPFSESGNPCLPTLANPASDELPSSHQAIQLCSQVMSTIASDPRNSWRPQKDVPNGVVIKIVRGHQIRRFTLERSSSFAQLERQITARFGLTGRFRLRYEDDESEMCKAHVPPLPIPLICRKSAASTRTSSDELRVGLGADSACAARVPAVMACSGIRDAAA